MSDKIEQGKVITRFAPSPTGKLHLGGARTALFNWLYARHNNGSFLLRIEDTDINRNTNENLQDILKGLDWLGINHDGEYVLQSLNIEFHRKTAIDLLKSGNAFYCYEKKSIDKEHNSAYRSPYRNGGYEHKDQAQSVLRFKVPSNIILSFHDRIVGRVEVSTSQIEDFVLLRSNGSPTYLLASASDDHQMGITDVIRGSDHLTNTFKHILIYNAMHWKIPEFAHIPLIHDENGCKLSKRMGALSICSYKEQGFITPAVANYLLRLSWSHGNNEIISLEDAISLFDLTKVGSSPPRLDLKKLEHFNHYYLNNSDCIIQKAIPFYEKALNRSLSSNEIWILEQASKMITERSCTLCDIVDVSKCLILRPATNDIGGNIADLPIIKCFRDQLIDHSGELSFKEINILISNTAKICQAQKSSVFQNLRTALITDAAALPIAKVASLIGKKECLSRIEAWINVIDQ